MSMLVWVMMAIALWHFTVLLPDRFYGGIVGALLAALAGAVLFGLALHGFSIPGRNDTDLGAAFEAIPGILIGLGFSYAWGVLDERRDPRRASISSAGSAALRPFRPLVTGPWAHGARDREMDVHPVFDRRGRAAGRRARGLAHHGRRHRSARLRHG